MKQRTVRLSDDLEVYSEESGQGSTVLLFIPGWTMSTRVFEHQLAFFENSADVRFITFDPRSHGRSTNADDGHTYEQHGRDLARFIETLELDNIVLGGWSFGTLTMLSYVQQFGIDRLCGLVLIDGPPKAVGVDDTSEWFTYYADDRDGEMEFFTMARLRNKEVANERFARWMLESETPDKIQWVCDITNQTPDTAAALLNATSVYCDFERELIDAANSLNLLYVLRKERLSDVERWAQNNTPDAVVTGFGEHLMFWEQAGRFNDILVNFLTRLR